MSTVHSRVMLFTTATMMAEAIRVRIYGGSGLRFDTTLEREEETCLGC